MYWFVEWDEENGRKSKGFYTVEKMFEWIQEYFGNHGKMPQKLCVFKAECVCDLS